MLVKISGGGMEESKMKSLRVDHFLLISMLRLCVFPDPKLTFISFHVTHSAFCEETFFFI